MHPRQLDASVEASGPYDFAVRFRAFVSLRQSVHRIPPNVRDDRETPLEWDGMAGNMDVIWGKREAKCFLRGGWTAKSKNGPAGKSR
jgi:hypothetical protein